jgi:hypothetical protein
MAREFKQQRARDAKSAKRKANKTSPTLALSGPRTPASSRAAGSWSA